MEGLVLSGLINIYPLPFQAFSIPVFAVIRIMLETSKLLNKLAIFEYSFVKTDNIKSGNDLLLFPKLLPLKEKNVSHSFF
jgi:hypothetical protein